MSDGGTFNYKGTYKKGSPFWIEQKEAESIAKQGMNWGSAICKKCQYEWLAYFYPSCSKMLHCPECKTMNGELVENK